MSGSGLEGDEQRKKLKPSHYFHHFPPYVSFYIADGQRKLEERSFDLKFNAYSLFEEAKSNVTESFSILNPLEPLAPNFIGYKCKTAIARLPCVILPLEFSSKSWLQKNQEGLIRLKFLNHLPSVDKN